MKKLSLILMSIFALGLITSCSSSSNDEIVNPGPDLVKGTKTLTLNIVGAQPAAGRSVGTLSAEEGNPLQVGGNEATINNLIVIIYDNVNNKFETANKFVNPSVATNNSISVKAYFNSTQPSVFVLANVPLNAVDGIVGQNLDAYKALSASLNLTSIDGTGAGTSQIPTNLPMVGSTTNLTLTTPSEPTEFNASVTLHRMVSRIALTSFTTNFSTTGESFTITDVFLKHVNTTSSYLHADVTADATKATVNGSPTVGGLADGLKVGNPSTEPTIISYLENSYTTNAWNNTVPGTPAYFYVFPNNASSFDAKTQLVIKGKYKANSTASEEDRYYVCVVNAVPDGTKVTYTTSSVDAGTGTIAANRKYTLKVTVTGTPQPEGDVQNDVDPNPTGTNNVNLTIDVADWAADIVQNVSF